MMDLKSLNTGEYKNKIATSWPESWMCKSEKQITLESNGCQFSKTHQERLDNHELDINKECYCGRPNKGK